MEIQIHVIPPSQTEDLKSLLTVFEDVFEMEPFTHPSDEYLLKLLSSGKFFAVIAKSENRVIGGLTVYILDQYYSEKPQAYIYDLAVLTEFQRRGIGKKLMAFTIEYCREQGYESAFVQAEEVDDYAVEFYRMTKPSEELVAVHFAYKLNA